MAIVHHLFKPGDFTLPNVDFPDLGVVEGTNYPYERVNFSSTADQRLFAPFLAVEYASGMTLSVDFFWNTQTVTTGNVLWGAAISALTPNVDSTDMDGDALDTENTVIDSHLGTTAPRLHLATVNIAGSDLEDLAKDDLVYLRIRRLGSSTSDTLAANVRLVYVQVSYQAE